MESSDPKRRSVTDPSEAEAAADDVWSGLSTDILIRIASKCVASAATYACLRSVCQSWRTALPVTVPNPHRLPQQLPFLLLVNGRCQDPVSHVYSLATRHTCPLHHLADTARAACVGSCHGWLFLLDPNYNLILRNPFTGDTIRLPSLRAILAFRPPPPPPPSLFRGKAKKLQFEYHYLVHRAILSSDPSADRDFLAVLFIDKVKSRCFAWQRGDHSWTVREHPDFVPEDVIFYEGRRCFAVASNQDCAVFDFAVADSGDGFFTKILEFSLPGSRYLVESAGIVWLVVVEIPSRQETKIRMNRLDFSFFPDLVVAFEDKDLGGRILFLAHGNSMSVASTDFPGFEGDCIYFTDIDWDVLQRRQSYFATIWEVQIKNQIANLRNVEAVAAMFSAWPKPRWLPPNLHKKLGFWKKHYITISTAVDSRSTKFRVSDLDIRILILLFAAIVVSIF